MEEYSKRRKTTTICIKVAANGKRKLDIIIEHMKKKDTYRIITETITEFNKPDKQQRILTGRQEKAINRNMKEMYE